MYQEVPQVAPKVGASKHGKVWQSLDAAKTGQVRVQNLKNHDSRLPNFDQQLYRALLLDLSH